MILRRIWDIRPVALRWVVITVLVLVLLGLISVIIISYKIPGPGKTIFSIGDPENLQIITEDYDVFWNAYESSKNADGVLDTEKFNEAYQANVSGELDEFSAIRYGSAMAVYDSAHMADFYKSYKDAISLEEMYNRRAVVAGYKELRRYLPDAILPNVRIFMGLMNNGGTVTSNSIIIAHEIFVSDAADWSKFPYPEKAERIKAYFHSRFGSDPNTSYLILHELIHYIQASQFNAWDIATMKFNKFMGEELLTISMKEGVADFLQSVLSKGAVTQGFLNQEKWVQDNNMEEILWKEFAENATNGNKEVFNQWLYTIPKDGRPADLGYWMGRKISQAYWDKAENKTQAFKDLIFAKEYKNILLKADFGSKF